MKKILKVTTTEFWTSRKLNKRLGKIKKMSATLSSYGNEQLKADYAEIKSAFGTEEKKESRAELAERCFALTNEAIKRATGLTPRDEQILCALAMVDSSVSEMKTGEGKTLAAIFAAACFSLVGKTHIMTANSYLAERDASDNQATYALLGITCSHLKETTDIEVKKECYAADVLYATASQLAFDFMTDNLVYSLDLRVQPELSALIVDEADHVLIDESQTPMTLTGGQRDTSKAIKLSDDIAKTLKVEIGEDELSPEEAGKSEADVIANLHTLQAYLSEKGIEKVEKALVEKGEIDKPSDLYLSDHLYLIEDVLTAVKAQNLLERDRDYAIVDGAIVIIDKHTGRLLEGRSWAGGLHQAVEFKEELKIKSEKRRFASTSLQNYVRRYPVLAGMTGTAIYDAEEFQRVYGLDVFLVPLSHPSQRTDEEDILFFDSKTRDRAIVEDIIRAHKIGQPVLVGTSSVDHSEIISELLNKEDVGHRVLNALNHQLESKIIRTAGEKGMVTVTTSMAGRGADIVLGEGVVELGGLRVLGAGRHQARRIDEQLIGRSGRQGDPGSSAFYLSPDDTLFSAYGTDKVKSLLRNFRVSDGEGLRNSLISKAINAAQGKLQSAYSAARKNLIEYDDILSHQRDIIYAVRDKWMNPENSVDQMIVELMTKEIELLVDQHLPNNSFEEQWRPEELNQYLMESWSMDANIKKLAERSNDGDNTPIKESLNKIIDVVVENNLAIMTDEGKRIVAVRAVDALWQTHMDSLDNLRRGIHLRGFASKDPAIEFKRESLEMFVFLLDEIPAEQITFIMKSAAAKHAEKAKSAA